MAYHDEVSLFDIQDMIVQNQVHLHEYVVLRNVVIYMNTFYENQDVLLRAYYVPQ